MENGLYIIATPIGNLGDISSRALQILQEADVIACEDTRVTKKLFSLLGLKHDKPFISYQDHNEEECYPKIIEILQSGKSVGLVSDAGSPLISDPGYKLVRKCRELDIKIYAVPGACAVISALQISGLPTNRFMFAGFIPNKESGRNNLFQELKNLNSTLVFYETANRLTKTLAAMVPFFEDREIAVAREITKIFEECKNGTPSSLLEYFSAHEPKGECVVMISPPQKNEDISAETLAELLKNELLTKSLKDAAKSLSQSLNLNRNEIYQLGLKIKNEN